MKTIYKYKLPIEAEVTLSIPGGGGNVLHVADQDGDLTIWIEVDTEQPNKDHKFRVVGTGQPTERVKDDFHVGSAVVGPFVWHVFSRLP